MAKIQVLDQMTIDKIAAGEVVERPSSIVKELVENALDAGATAVTVEIKEGGISLIRIADNGCGIPKEEVPLAFLRHATSKIRSADDLVQVSSLGFRGEALSSIAAISQVELITKTRDCELGVKYQIEGGIEKGIEEIGARDGTTFLIRQIFYNTPARRKFLKTPTTEAGYVGDLMTRLALSHPEVAIQFINNGQTKLHTSGNGNVKDVIYQVFGREVANHLLEIDAEAQGMRVTGFIGEPLISRGNRNYEQYDVNGRYVKSAILAKGIEDAYKDFMMQHKYPFTVLHFTMDGSDLDVNVHPTKMELRFRDKQQVYDFVYRTLKQALSEHELIPRVELPAAKESPAQTRTSMPTTVHDQSKKFSLQEDSLKEKDGLVKTSMSTMVHDRMQTHVKTPSMPAQDFQTPQRNYIAKDFRTERTEQEANALTPTQKEERNPKLEQKSATNAKVDYSDEPKQKTEQASSTNPKLDYFMEKMRERVTSYYNQMSQAEVKQKDGVHRGQEQIDRIRETVRYRKQEEKQEDKQKEKQLNLFEEKLLTEESVKQYHLIGQVFDTYWLVEFQEQLYIIDQHAAHERVLYERTLHSMNEREFTSQYISPPIVLHLSMQEMEVLQNHMEQFTKIGFEIESFGGNSYAVRAVPDNLFSIAKQELLLEMLDELADGICHASLAPDLILEKIASMSCKAAVKGNARLSATEVDALIGELLKLDNPYHCPHGRPTIIAITKRELEKKFKRIV